MSFGELLRRHRRRSGLSQDDLAARVGLSVTGIRNLETGRTRAPRPSTVRLLVDAFGLDGQERDRFLLAAAVREADDGTTSARVAERSPGWPLPAQLPPDVPGFTGRVEALRRLDQLATLDAPPGPVVVAGTAGVGKSALVVHWAHTARERFPDGQLFAQLHGFDAASATPPDDVVRAFLEAMAVPIRRTPANPDARSGLLRSLLAGRRMLIVLDDARDAEQVRPVLPGTPGCRVVVTSRSRLAGLVARDAARLLPLDVLPRSDARDLLRGRLGADRVEAEPEAVDEIVTRCAGLPLALTVVAARAVLSPNRRLTAIRADLDAAGGLDAFAGTDPAADLRGVLSWSYRSLSGEAARLFRLLALHPGPDVAPAAAASLAGDDTDRTRGLLEALTDAHLLTPTASDRFARHDLLRAYGAELVAAGEDDARAATGRLLDHYLHTAAAAARLLTPGRNEPALADPVAGVTTTPLLTHDDALAWFATEEATLPALVDTAAAMGFDGHAWRLCDAAANYLQRRGRWTTLLTTGRTALAAARRADDVRGQVLAHCGLARASTWLRRTDEARDHASQADALCRGTDDVTLQAHTSLDLALVFERQDRYDVAAHYAERAHAHFEVAHDRLGMVRSLNMVAWCRAQLGEFESAAATGRVVVEAYGELHDVAGEANAWDTLGYAEHMLGHHDRAADCYRRSHELFTTAGDRYGQAQALGHLGDVLAHPDAHPDARHGGRTRDESHDDPALAAWHAAVRILDELGHPDAAAVRAKLAGRTASR